MVVLHAVQSARDDVEEGGGFDEGGFFGEADADGDVLANARALVVAGGGDDIVPPGPTAASTEVLFVLDQDIG